MAETRTITEGPFWAVMLPDGRLLRCTASECAFFWKHQKDAAAECACFKQDECRVVRVRSVTYEVEVE